MKSAVSSPPGDARSVARVLVVDDDAMMRTVLHRLFVDAGFKVETFSSAGALLAEADLVLPGVLVLDVRMPGMSGLELQTLLRLRAIELPVMFLTGNSDVPMAVEAMRNGAVDFIEKPFAPAGLVQRVRCAFEHFLRTTAVAVPTQPVLDHARRLATLTPRERDVHDCVVLGLTSKQIAQELGGSFRTVEIHRARVMGKMGVTHLADLVRLTVDAENAKREADGLKRESVARST